MLKKLAILIMVCTMILSLFAFSASATETGKVIYIKDGGTGDGSSPENALGVGDSGKASADAPLYQAWEELYKTGGTIVICGPYTLKKEDAARTVGAPDVMYYDGKTWFRNPDVTITYTSVYGGVDYRETAGAKLQFDNQNTALTFPTATVLKDITVVGGDCAADRFNYLAAAYCELTLGQGTNFIANAAGKMPMVIGGHRNYSGIAAVNGDTKITVDIGNSNSIGAIYGNLGYANKDQKGSSYITIKSGKVTGIYGDNQNNHNYGLTGSINIDIQGGIICGEVAVTNNGYGAGSEQKATLKISGGDFSNCTKITDKSAFFLANSPNNPAPLNLTVDCSAASWEVYDKVAALTSLTVTEPAEPRPTEPPATEPPATEPPVDDTPAQTGDVISVVVAMLAASSAGLVLLKKKR